MKPYPSLLFSAFCTLAFLISGCNTKPIPTPEQTLASGLGSHAGWVDTDVVGTYHEDPEGLKLRDAFNRSGSMIGGKRTGITAGVGTALNEQRNRLPSIYFGFDQSAISEAERPKVEQTANYLQQHPEHRLRLEGNCDWRGTAQYNLVLGDRRASSVKQFLTILGIDPDQIDTVSYGDQFATIEGTKVQMNEDRRVDLVILVP